MSLDLRPIRIEDGPAVLALYQAAAAGPGGLARRSDEMDLAYVRAFIGKALNGGVALGVWDGAALAGEIHASRIGPDQFAHVLCDLTVAVLPAQQGRGVGSRLFTGLFEVAAKLVPKVQRIELMARAGNIDAVRLYERLGFVLEGRFVGRVRMPDGTVEDDLAMARRL